MLKIKFRISNLSLSFAQVILIASCAKYAENTSGIQNISSPELLKTQNEGQVHILPQSDSKKNTDTSPETLKNLQQNAQLKSTYEKIEDQNVRTIESPDHKQKILLNRFVVQNAQSKYFPSSKKFQFLGKARFEINHKIEEYDFDLEGIVDRSRSQLKSADNELKNKNKPQNVEFMAVLFAQNYDDGECQSQDFQTCGQYFIHLYAKFKDQADVVYETQITPIMPRKTDAASMKDKDKSKESAAQVSDAGVEDSEDESSYLNQNSKMSFQGLNRPEKVQSIFSSFEKPKQDVKPPQNQAGSSSKTQTQPGSQTTAPAKPETSSSSQVQKPDTSAKVKPEAAPGAVQKPTASSFSDFGDSTPDAATGSKGFSFSADHRYEFPFNIPMPTHGPQQSIGGATRGALRSSTEMTSDTRANPHYIVADRTLQLKRNFGTFYVVEFLKAFGDYFYKITGGFALKINDISRQKGGAILRVGTKSCNPHVTGSCAHSWHQSGLDVDIPYNNQTDHPMTIEEKWHILKRAAISPLVDEIFTFQGDKRSICIYLKNSNLDAYDLMALKKLKPGGDHRDHFHIHFNCAHNSECMEDDNLDEIYQESLATCLSQMGRKAR